MEERKYQCSNSPYLLENRLNNLRSKYLWKMMHQNKVQQNHIRSQEKYLQEKRNKLEEDNLRHQNLKNHRQKQQRKLKKQKNKLHKTKLEETFITNSSNYETPSIGQCKSLNVSLGCVKIKKDQNSETPKKLRMNTIHTQKQKKEEEYSTHIMLQNLQRFDKYKNNKYVLGQARQRQYQEAKKKRQRTVQINQSVLEDKENKLIEAYCQKMQKHDKLKQKLIKDRQKQSKLVNQLHLNSMSMMEQRVKKELKISKKKLAEKQNSYLVKQNRALQIKEEIISKSLQRMRSNRVKQDRAKYNRDEYENRRRQNANRLVEDHIQMSAMVQNHREKLQKYRQQKMMMDFLSHEHSSKFNQ